VAVGGRLAGNDKRAAAGGQRQATGSTPEFGHRCNRHIFLHKMKHDSAAHFLCGGGLRLKARNGKCTVLD